MLRPFVLIMSLKVTRKRPFLFIMVFNVIFLQILHESLEFSVSDGI